MNSKDDGKIIDKGNEAKMNKLHCHICSFFMTDDRKQIAEPCKGGKGGKSGK